MRPTFIFCLLALCAPALRAQTPPRALPLLQADRVFSILSVKRGAAAAFAAFLAPDAVSLPNKQNIQTGRWAIVEGLRPDTNYTLSWTPLRADIARSGELGYTFGTYTFTERAAGKAVTHYGKYATVWRKQRGGAWKVILDTGNPSPPPAPLK